MSTFNGFGTMYYGWRHRPDGTAAATKWLVAMWVPILPLARHELRVLTDLSAPEPFLKTGDAGFLAGVPIQYTQYDLLSTGRPAIAEVLATYAWTYVLGPLLMVWPILVARWVGDWLDEHPHQRESTMTLVVVGILSILILVNPIVVGLRAIRRARGQRAL